MIQSALITNHLGESILIELRFPEKSGFLIREILGLDPPKGDIKTTSPSPRDGASFNSARMDIRNIVINLTLLENPTIQASRRATYKYFPIDQQITMMFDTEDSQFQIVGYVESNDINIFGKEQQASISVICPEPYLYSVDTQVTNFASIEGLFEFPFSNESLVIPLIEFSSLTGSQEKTVYYEGDISVGVIIYIHAIGPVVNLEIANVQTQEVMSILHDKLVTLLGSGISTGDDIIISTVKGNKYISLVRNGVSENILNSLDKNIGWFQLTKGDNVFIFTADSGATNLNFRIENQLAFQGI